MKSLLSLLSVLLVGLLGCSDPVESHSVVPTFSIETPDSLAAERIEFVRYVVYDGPCFVLSGERQPLAVAEGPVGEPHTLSFEGDTFAVSLEAEVLGWSYAPLGRGCENLPLDLTQPVTVGVRSLAETFSLRVHVESDTDTWVGLYDDEAFCDESERRGGRLVAERWVAPGGVAELDPAIGTQTLVAIEPGLSGRRGCLRRTFGQAAYVLTVPLGKPTLPTPL